MEEGMKTHDGPLCLSQPTNCKLLQEKGLWASTCTQASGIESVELSSLLWKSPSGQVREVSVRLVGRCIGSRGELDLMQRLSVVGPLAEAFRHPLRNPFS
ncbi:hypothetical protein EYF80_009590 [Liparis tanakae]|uniref:Uncharacterized protein n=1 Tax=Liparis tanakae TaxID=230148 RepID=A0A4Z2IQS4_9TELE|nr:hypothetical protein EYF80_009590 [Liparis tanakae]